MMCSHTRFCFQADSLQQELDMLQQTYNALQETHQQTQERIVALEKEVTELSQVKAKAIEDREQFEHQKAVLSDRFESQLSEANKHHEALTYEKANLSAELEKIKRTLQDATEFRDQVFIFTCAMDSCFLFSDNNHN